MKNLFTRLRRKYKILFPFGVFLILLAIFGILQEISYKKKNQNITKVGVITIGSIIFSTEPFLEQINSFAEDKDIAAIILKINSPGGAVAPVQEIFNKLVQVREKKSVYAYVSTLAASGGYYLAAASDKIYASKGSTLGSIGVIFQYIRYGDLLKKIGAESIVIKSGKHKDIISPFRKPSDAEIQIIQELVDESYEQFVADIAFGRNMKKEKIIPIADGRIFSGVQSKKLGLIDEIGGFEQLLEDLKNSKNIKKIELIYPEKKLQDYWKEIQVSLGAIFPLKNLQLSGLLAVYSF